MRRLLIGLVPALLLIAPPTWAGPGEKALRAVPRSVQVSVGRDHVWGSVRATRVPSEVGEEDWSKWDRDGSGDLAGAELRALAAWIGAREVQHVCVSIDGTILPLSKFGPRYVGDESVPVALDGTVSVRVEGRTKVALGPGIHHWVLYDVPPHRDGFVPIRFTTVKGFAIREAQGARGERRGEQRLEVTATAFNPGMWGTLERVVPGR